MDVLEIVIVILTTVTVCGKELEKKNGSRIEKWMR
jgi:hypothetical protein